MEDATPNIATPPTAGKKAFRASYTFLIVVTLINLVADLGSKQWAKAHFDAIRVGTARKMVIIEDVMNFIYAKNRGGAWGLFQNESEALRRPFFLIVSVAAIVFIVSLYAKLQSGQTALKWGLPLVLGGALGNLFDRVYYGFVIDFIDIYVTMDGAAKHWPTFNVADISICLGVGLMAVDMFTSRTTAEKTESASSKAADPTSDPLVADGAHMASAGSGFAVDSAGSGFAVDSAAVDSATIDITSDSATIDITSESLADASVPNAGEPEGV